MICQSCMKKSNHIILAQGINGKYYEVCPFCAGFSEAGGTKSDGLLVRNSFRIRRNAVMNEGDTLPPHVYDKQLRKIRPREDFIKRFPERINDTYTQKELDDAGLSKLKIKKPIEKNKIEFNGNQNNRLKEIL